jgi:acyl-coenzyme A synthetase/AMP-(fatty) acid ligase
LSYPKTKPDDVLHGGEPDPGERGKIVVYYEDEKYTFNDICNLTNRVGNVLKELGVGFEDRVLLILQDSPEWLAG